MRYQIGEKIIGIGFYLDATIPTQPDFLWSSLGLILSMSETPWKVKLIQMEIKEHHKVAWDQDPAGEKKYDGFVLIGNDGNNYNNQYPTASYGQISDFGDCVFTIETDGENIRELKKSNKVLRYVLIGEYYRELKQFFHRNPYVENHISERLISAIDEQLKEQFNLKMVEVPVFPDLPGMEDITKFVTTPISD